MDKLNMPKILSPVFSARRIKKAGGQDRGLENRRFSRQLRQEEEKAERDESGSENGAEKRDDQTKAKPGMKRSGLDEKPEVAGQTEKGQPFKGNVIDIRI